VRARAVLLVALLVALAGCGGGDESTGGEGGQERPRLVVSAAASLKTAFTAYGREFPDADVRLSFAGSGELAAQIRQGVTPDVFAAADTKLPEQLFADGLVERPTVFAGNRLVLAVPAGERKVRGLEDLERGNTPLAIGAEGVPVGSYTRTVLERLPAARRRAVLANVRTEEPDVGGIVGKLTQGAVDAGFVYVSDVRGTDGALRAIELPPDLQPDVAYGVAVVKGASQPAAARRFIAGLLDGRGAEALRAAGFEPPPGE
jgi:molybdate transport system substrate-binding protein